MSNSWEQIRNRLLGLKSTHGAVADFCRKGKIPRQTVEYWLKGQAAPSIEKIDDIATGLGISPEELVRDADNRFPQDEPEASMLLELLKNFSPMKRELIGVISALGDDRLKRLLAEAHALKKDAP